MHTPVLDLRMHHRRTLFLIAILMLLLAAPAFGQHSTTRLYTTADGLADRVVTDMHRDERGFLWVLSAQGLQRFDGHRFRSYTHVVPDSLRRSLIGIRNFHIDPDGWIWLVEAQGRHALRFDPLSERVEVKHGPVVLPTTGDLSRVCTNLYPFYDVIQAGGETADLQQRIPEAIGDDELKALQRTADGHIWLHLSNGRLLMLDPADGSIELAASAGAQPIGRPSWPALGSDGILWLPETAGKLRRIKVPTSMLDEADLVPHLDGQGGYWLISLDRRVYELPRDSDTFYDHGPPVARIQRIYGDHEGLIWLATEIGLLSLRHEEPLFTAIASKPPVDDRQVVLQSLRRMVMLPGKTVLATNDEGSLLRIDGDGMFHHISLPLRGRSISDMTRTADGSIWLLSDGVLHQLDPGGMVVMPAEGRPDGVVRAIHAATQGTALLLLQENDQAVIYDPVLHEHGTPFPLPLAKSAAVLLEGHQLIVPHANGLRVVDTRTGITRTMDLDLPEPLLEDGVRGMARLGGRIYLGTSNGLLGIDTLSWKVVQRLGYAEGLADAVVYSLIAANDHLWVGTRNGLSMVEPATGECMNFRKPEGLPFNEFNSGALLHDVDGRLWMGGVNGLVRFIPEQVAALEPPGAILHFSELRSYDQATATWTSRSLSTTGDTKPLVLGADTRTLSIAFMLSSLAAPKENRYSYYLEGLEPPWFHTGSTPAADHLDLPPGNYTFRVRAYDHWGRPALNELALPINVLEVWYLRPWALALYAILGVLLVVLATRLVMQHRLAQAEALRITELDAFKDRFFANVTHEFRTPITVMLGLARQLGKQNGSTPAERNNALVIRRNGHRLLGLLEQLMDLTRAQHGRLQLDPRPGKVLEFLRSHLDSHIPLAQVRGIKYIVVVEGSDVPVAFDVERLRQIADNLVSNALKFTPSGGSVTVNANLIQGNPHRLVFTVTDTGAGIASADLPHVFDRFFQGSAENRTVTSGGMGIGLALVKELVEAMGGIATATNLITGGACFTIEIPLEEAAAPLAAQIEKEARAVSIAPAYTMGSVVDPSSEKPVLLVVEDDLDLGDHISSSVQDQFQVLRAMDGIQGLAMAYEHIPDLVLSDVMMPGMDGYGLCQRLKIDQRTSHVPVALLTARNDQPSRLEGIAQGADAYLVKPFDEQELLGVLRNLLRLQRSIKERYQQEWEQQSKDRENTQDQKPKAGDTENAEAGIEHVFLARVHELLEANYQEQDYSVERLSEQLNLSRSQILRKIKALTGQTPVNLLRSFRLKKAEAMLDRGGYTVAEVAYTCGFNTPNYFSDVYLQVLGRRPSEQKSL